MVSLFSQRGVQWQVPTVEELKGWIFKDVMKEMKERLNEVRRSWAETGCSILLDGWTDANGRTLVNVLVDCPKSTVYLFLADITDCVGNMDAMQIFLVKVLAEVGIPNVVQIITYSSSDFMKEAGRQLMERYRPVFWTVSASHCIELMLEKLCRVDLINKTLEKAKIITRFVHSHSIALKYLQDQTKGSGLIDTSMIRSIRPFLILENIEKKKETLNTMFSPSHSQSSILISTMEGRRAAELVGDHSFWNEASTILKGTMPLVRVIEWMNKSGKDHMGLIYETIDQAKETIKDCFKNKSAYSLFWKTIDYVWNESLYSPVHSAGYYLNPNLLYSSNGLIDPELIGLLPRWSITVTELPKVPWLPESLKSKDRTFLLFQLSRSLAETLLFKGRNLDEQKWLRDMVFLRYTMQLQNFVPGNVVSNEPGLVDDWLADRNNVP
ncbi:uncharacterized protein LOC121781699 [Salvia splendens]|uniref:uncharacterized protein LOC121781699 n=1 Tax=Salvia splendens TaxID=180675 RepID=UPI001C26CC9A|nr:uncharacterized protein LOC121781699 [Salvia splendens]